MRFIKNRVNLSSLKDKYSTNSFRGVCRLSALIFFFFLCLDMILILYVEIFEGGFTDLTKVFFATFLMTLSISFIIFIILFLNFIKNFFVSVLEKWKEKRKILPEK